MKQFNNITIIPALLIFVILAFSAVLYFKNSKHISINIPQLAPTKSVRINPDLNLLTEVEKRVVMPKGSPLIFNLSDIDYLTNQPFFAGAKPTDKLILFNEDKKAILYDPIANQIINIGPLMIIPATPEAQISQPK